MSFDTTISAEKENIHEWIKMHETSLVSVNNTKANLSRDPNEFIKSYFAAINDRLKR